MPDIGDQIVAVAQHPAVGPDDGEAFRRRLHALRVEGAVKALRGGDRPLRWVVRQEQGQRHLRVALFRLLDRAGRQPVKAAVMPRHKLRHAVLDDMPLHLLGQRGQYPFAGLPVADKKAGAHGAVPPLLPREDVSHGVIQKVIVTSYLLIALLYHCIAIKGNFNL